MEARRAVAIALAGLTATAVTGCGGGTRQDANERSATYRVQVVRASFPEKQSLAQVSHLVITVRNDSGKTVPNIAVTVHGFNTRAPNSTLADPNRPRFVINATARTLGGFPEAKEAGPTGGETAYYDTWALGKLQPREQKTFTWSVTAVKAGPYKISYRVAGGLNGKAKAVDASGHAPVGIFAGTVSATAPRTRVADDGTTIVQGTR